MRQLLCIGGRCIGGYMRRGPHQASDMAVDNSRLLIALTVTVGIASALVVLLLCESVRSRAEAKRKDSALTELKSEVAAREAHLFSQLEDFASRELRLLSDLRETTFEKEEAIRKLGTSSSAPLGLGLFQLGLKDKSRVRTLSEVGADELDSASVTYVADSPGGSLLASQLASLRNSRAPSVVGSQLEHGGAENVVACGPMGGPLPGMMPPPPPPRKGKILGASPSSTNGDYAESPVPKPEAPQRPVLAPRHENEMSIIWGS